MSLKYSFSPCLVLSRMPGGNDMDFSQWNGWQNMLDEKKRENFTRGTYYPFFVIKEEYRKQWFSEKSIVIFLFRADNGAWLATWNYASDKETSVFFTPDTCMPRQGEKLYLRDIYLRESRRERKEIKINGNNGNNNDNNKKRKKRSRKINDDSEDSDDDEEDFDDLASSACFEEMLDYSQELDMQREFGSWHFERYTKPKYKGTLTEWILESPVEVERGKLFKVEF